MIVWVIVAAAAALLLWPTPSDSPYAPAITVPPVEATRAHSYLQSLSALQVVRARLLDTEQLGEAQQEAINALTLALVSGSDK